MPSKSRRGVSVSSRWGWGPSASEKRMTLHDDDVLGKAYDARLMRRLLEYLRPYWRQVAVAFVAIIVGAAASLAQPYLIKVAIDDYIATGASTA